MWTRLRSGAGTVAVLFLAAVLLSGCPSMGEYVNPYGMGLARIGDDYQLFVPLCSGEQVIQVWAGADERTPWWVAQGPKSATGPGEWIVLGDDRPFTAVPTPAGRPAPAPVEVKAWIIDYQGLSRQVDDGYSAIPSYPAGADPRTVRYRFSRDHEKHTAEEIRRLSQGCVLGGDPAVAPPPGLQPAGSIKADARQRAARALSGADLGAAGLVESPPQWPTYEDDVGSRVCGNKVGPDLDGSAFGWFRRWRAEAVQVDHWTGVYGVPPAVEQITAARAALRCAGYREFSDEYRNPHEVPLAGWPLAYCEKSPGDGFRCTALLARGDVLTRLQIAGPTEQWDRELLARMAPAASAALAEAW